MGVQLKSQAKSSSALSQLTASGTSSRTADSGQEAKTSEYVLHEPFSSESQGKTLCFAGMTGIGPRAGANPDEWVRFDSERAALRCPAFYHSLTFYQPWLESEIAGGKDQ